MNATPQGSGPDAAGGKRSGAPDAAANKTATNNTATTMIATTRELLDMCLQGAEANDRDDLKRRLTAARRTLSGSPSPGAVRDAAAEAVRALDSLKIDLNARRALLADPARVARLRAEFDKARERSDRVQARSREWPALLSEGFAAISSDAEFALRSRARAVIADGEQTIDADDPKKSGDKFATWLRDRLLVEADATYALLLRGARQVSGKLAAQLELPAPHPVRSLPVVPPARLVAELPDRHASIGGGTPTPTRMLGIVMPAYGGIMMALVMSRFLGLQLPGWVIAVCAVVGAAGLGGAAVFGERKRQLDRRRSEVKSTMRATLDEYQLAMSKQIRDATRVLQHDLRRATTTVVTEQSTSVGAALEVAREASETARKASGDLTDISDDLDSIAQLRARAQRILKPPPPRDDDGPRPDGRPVLTVA